MHSPAEFSPELRTFPVSPQTCPSKMFTFTGFPFSMICVCMSHFLLSGVLPGCGMHRRARRHTGSALLSLVVETWLAASTRRRVAVLPTDPLFDGSLDCLGERPFLILSLERRLIHQERLSELVAFSVITHLVAPFFFDCHL